ncbi:hypothetical protein F444_22564, partial [Phytophthora nicotianae P1976]
PLVSISEIVDAFAPSSSAESTCGSAMSKTIRSTAIMRPSHRKDSRVQKASTVPRDPLSILPKQNNKSK